MKNEKKKKMNKKENTYKIYTLDEFAISIMSC